MSDSKDKIVLNRENYPSNSIKSREKRSENKSDRPSRTAIVAGRRPKKSFFQRVANAFIDGETGSDVGDYIVHDVVIPAAKSTFADLVEGAIEMILFGGDARARGVSRYKGRSYISTPYDKMYRSDGRRGGRPDSRRSGVSPRRNRHDFRDVVMNTRTEAELVLQELVDIIEEYDVVTVTELLDLVGLPSEYTDNKYGWYELDGVSACRVRDGWALELPRPVVIE